MEVTAYGKKQKQSNNKNSGTLLTEKDGTQYFVMGKVRIKVRLYQKPRRSPLLGGRAGGRRGGAPDLPHGAGGGTGWRKPPPALPPMVWSIPPITGAAVGQAGADQKAP